MKVIPITHCTHASKVSVLDYDFRDLKASRVTNTCILPCHAWTTITPDTSLTL